MNSNNLIYVNRFPHCGCFEISIFSLFVRVHYTTSHSWKSWLVVWPRFSNLRFASLLITLCGKLIEVKLVSRSGHFILTVNWIKKTKENYGSPRSNYEEPAFIMHQCSYIQLLFQRYCKNQCIKYESNSNYKIWEVFKQTIV